MKVLIVPEDKYIKVNGEGLNFNYECNSNIHAIHWNGVEGVVELKVGGTRPATAEEVQYYVDLWTQEKQRLSLPPPVEPDSPEKIRKRKKQDRTEAVSKITVTTTSGKVFDGDEISQDRMARAILALDLGETTLWVLANNVPTSGISREELKEALRLAGAAQTAIWSIPYMP